MAFPSSKESLLIRRTDGAVNTRKAAARCARKHSVATAATAVATPNIRDIAGKALRDGAGHQGHRAITPPKRIARSRENSRLWPGGAAGAGPEVGRDTTIAG